MKQSRLSSFAETPEHRYRFVVAGNHRRGAASLRPCCHLRPEPADHGDFHDCQHCARVSARRAFVRWGGMADRLVPAPLQRPTGPPGYPDSMGACKGLSDGVRVHHGAGGTPETRSDRQTAFARPVRRCGVRPNGFERSAPCGMEAAVCPGHAVATKQGADPCRGWRRVLNLRESTARMGKARMASP